MAGRSRKSRYRRGRSGFLYKVLSVLLILAAVVVGSIVFFRVEEVTVTGSTVYTDEEIIAAAGVELGDNLFLINKIQVSRRMIGKLPYIDEVNPRRVLPNKLVFSITECTPVAVIEGEDGSWWVADAHCKLLEQGGNELENRYPVITGLVPLMPSEGGELAVSAEETVKLSALKQILIALESRGMLGQIQHVDLTRDAEIYMRYENRLNVRMSLYSDDFDRQIRVVQQAAASDVLSNGQSGTLDLIVEDGSQAHFVPD